MPLWKISHFVKLGEGEDTLRACHSRTHCVMCQSLLAQWGRGKGGSETWTPETFPSLAECTSGSNRRALTLEFPLPWKTHLDHHLQRFLKAPWATLVLSKVAGGVRTLKIFLIRLIFLFSFLQANFTGFWAQLNLLLRWCLLVHSTMTGKFQDMGKVATNKTVLIDHWIHLKMLMGTHP